MTDQNFVEHFPNICFNRVKRYNMINLKFNNMRDFSPVFSTWIASCPVTLKFDQALPIDEGNCYCIVFFFDQSVIA